MGGIDVNGALGRLSVIRTGSDGVVVKVSETPVGCPVVVRVGTSGRKLSGLECRSSMKAGLQSGCLLHELSCRTICPRPFGMAPNAPAMAAAIAAVTPRVSGSAAETRPGAHAT